MSRKLSCTHPVRSIYVATVHGLSREMDGVPSTTCGTEERKISPWAAPGRLSFSATRSAGHPHVGGVDPDRDVICCMAAHGEHGRTLAEN